eukprot:gene10144-9952_t
MSFIMVADLLGRLGLSATDSRWLYPVKIGAVVLALWWGRCHYTELRWRGLDGGWWARSVGVGLLVLVLWLKLDAGWMVVGSSAGFDPTDEHGVNWLLALLRLAGAALVVPVMEELFWRSFLLRWLVVMLGGFLFSLPAHAALSDTLHPFAGSTYSYDSNLFRADGGFSDPAESDRVRETFAGVGVDRTFGRQRLSGSARISRVNFDRFSLLDYSGRVANATLYWQLGNHLDGQLGGSYSSALTSFSDYQGSERNLRVQRADFVDGGWRFHPSWRVRARLSKDKYEYDVASQRYLNREDKASEVGIDYLGISGSTIGLQVRRVKGDYPTPQALGPFVFDPSYTQNDVKLKVFWKFSEQHQLQFLGGRVRRGHESQILRDSNGTNGRVTDTWNVTRTVSLVSALWREYIPFEGSSASYSLNKGGSIDGKWVVSSKIQATGQLRYLERDFAGFAAPVTIAPQDKAHVISLGLNYSPLQNLMLSASVNRDHRTTNTRFSRSYQSNGASFSASIEF